MFYFVCEDPGCTVSGLVQEILSPLGDEFDVVGGFLLTERILRDMMDVRFVEGGPDHDFGRRDDQSADNRSHSSVLRRAGGLLRGLPKQKGP